GRLARGTVRRLAHRGRVRVDADDQRPGFAARQPQDGGAVTRSQVDDRPCVAADQVGQLADVHLEQATADHVLHAADGTTGSRPLMESATSGDEAAPLAGATRWCVRQRASYRSGSWASSVPPITISGSSTAAGSLLTRRWVRVASSPQPGNVQTAVS